jgi:AcrR family transcriptional regulator
MNKEVDRRVIKTRQIIQDALFSLMQEKPYNKITIQEIIDRANVGRSTFYSHYETKEDLLISCIEHLLQMLNQFMLNYLDTADEKPRLLPVAELFDHIYENHRIMRGLLKSEEGDAFFNRIQTYWNNSIEEYIKSKLPKEGKPAIPLEILTNHITGTLIQLLKWWTLNKMPYTSAEMDEYFHQLINPCIASVIGKK